MKQIFALLALGMSLSFGAAHAADATSTCTDKATEKKLAGAAKTSFIKKCVADAGTSTSASNDASAACEKSAADKKLAGAAKKSHIKKCMADTAPAPQAAASAPKK
jgi:hypothetical protein